MRKWQKSLGVVTVSGAMLGAAVLGVDLFHDGQFALAEQNVQATRQQLSAVEDSSDVYRDVHRVVEPSVVEITVTKTIQRPQAEIPQEFQQYFHQFGGDGQFFNMPPGMFGNSGPSTMREVGTGSGVIMDVSDGYGYILTNNHVAGDASEMTVTLSDGRVIKDAQLVGADPKTDLAVIKIKADHLIPAVWGDSTELESGDQILAFGAPFGYVGSMTHGIVSALHRQAGILGQDGYENFIQVDAPINPGNSGGPLVNLHGQVVGINTAIASSSGGFQGIGFAIPSEEARPIYNELRQNGKIVRGWLGIEIENVSAATDEAASEGYRADTGVLVHGVLHNSPATDELRPGDIVTKLNGREIDNVTELRDKIAFAAPGSEVALDVFRDGKDVDVKVKLGEQPANLAEVAENTGGQVEHAAALGLQLQNITDELSQQYGLSDKSGAVVTEVAPNSPAAEVGIQPGDVITHVNRHRVHNAEEAGRALGDANIKTGVQLQIDNQQGSEFVFVKTDQN
ncbi:MAG TPA: PDZ domain-containing protein [Tepidisphaeraceae bacterium]|nr:PDZ domain-containing protein [Tepidisphaeraceae bacterium]